ncbi:MAG: VTC domain-containing protein, partial [Clostridia bacterium]|nr:VTC domain-containing protein [Clostridia bacterium]
FLSYDRVAFYDKDNHDFRLTFDTNLISRDYDLELEKGVYGEKILNDDNYIMEVKCVGGYPMWFVEVLNELKIYPHSYSKYGTIYQESLEKVAHEYVGQNLDIEDDERVVAFSKNGVQQVAKALA